MNTRLYLIPIIAAWLLFAACCAASGSLAQDTENCEMTAWFGQEEPYLLRDARTGRVTGPDAELMREMLAAIGCRLVFLELPWKRAIALVRAGDLDMVPFASYTVEREEFGHYSVPYRTTYHRFISTPENGLSDHSLPDFLARGGRIATMLGYSYPLGISTTLSHPAYENQIIILTSYDQQVQMLRTGRVDGIIASDTTLQHRVIKAGDVDFEIKVIDVYPANLHFLFSRKSVSGQTVERINQFLETRPSPGN
ncbi:substrate-binding periplasmic protein [Roseibium aquae]|uniref:substrate-binding periplasmic protein n=1 Tax=Roseibium aquae TaxID=1323746 RepID=UPI0015629509|nr:transporter substrate-binding domain-containing protein [Roseibium aquae]